MLVISVLNQKGGSGKTTIATHLGRAFQLAGYDVLMYRTLSGKRINNTV